MPNRLQPRLTFANVVSCLALFVALGGASYAAVKLPKNSVGTRQLKKNAVTKKKVRKNAVNSSKVRNHSLRAVDFKAGQLPAGPKGDPGPVGPTQGLAISQLTGATPPDSYEFSSSTSFFEKMTLTTGGRLFVFLRGELEVSCSAGAFAALGIFVDGVPASASGYRIPVGEPKEVSLWGISEPVAAGEHTLRLGADCANGKHNSSGASGDGAIGAILLGS